MNILADLFLTFAKIGCFTFGGGYAMIALIEDACVEKKKWITHDDMMNVTVVAESTPGPIAINCATFTGYRQAGLAGAFAATIGMVLPSFLIIFAISCFMDNFLEVAWIAKAIRGIRIAVGLLILDAGLTMLKKMNKKQMQQKQRKQKLFSKIVVVCAFSVMLAVNLFSIHLSTIVLLIFAAAAGIAVSFAGGNAAPGAGGQGNPGEAAVGKELSHSGDADGFGKMQAEGSIQKGDGSHGADDPGKGGRT